jgi:predicted TIM-barrel fold metal-dependent hydrolase
MLILGEGPVIDYPIVDADAHVNEPPNLWLERLPARYRDRAPRVVPYAAGGDAWSFDGGKRVAPVSFTATAGLSPLQFKPAGTTYAEMRPGSFEPKARIADMNLDGIFAQLLYPSITLTGAKPYTDDPELQVLCVRAYNDWLADFCAACPERLFGLAIIPTTGAEAAVDELEHALARGMRGALLSAYPNGTLDPADEDDRFWSRCVEADLPVNIHIGSFMRDVPQIPMTGTRFLGLVGPSKCGGLAFGVVGDFIFTGLFDKFPGLKVVLVESNIGWVPTFLEQTDDMFLRYRFWSGGTDLRLLPSEYFYRNVWTTFMIDTAGMALRYRCGLDHVMWSTDYPHSGTDWPNSRVTLDRNFRGLPYAEVKRMIQENAAALYRIAVPGQGIGAGRQ